MRKSLDMIYARDKMVSSHLRLTDMCRRAIEDVDDLIRKTMEEEAKEIRAELPLTDEIPERRILRINFKYGPIVDGDIRKRKIYMSSPHLADWLPVADGEASAERVLIESLREYFNKRYNHNAVVFTPIDTVYSMFTSIERRDPVPSYILVELFYRPLPNITTYVIDDEEVKSSE